MPVPKKNFAYTMNTALIDRATGQIKSNPTLAAGDFKVSLDGAALANLGTLPLVEPAAGPVVKVAFSQAEMNADRVCLVCQDAAGAEWNDKFIYIDTTLATEDDVVYHVAIDLTREPNVRDEYTVTWFKNGVPVLSGITLPKIQVVKRADGLDLVAEAAMTQIGTTGSYKFDEATNRITVGEAVLVIVSATIDGAVRSWRWPRSRDSA